MAGRTILARQVDALAALGVRPSLVAPDPTPFAGTGLRVVPDAVAAGALGALFTALHRAADPHVLVLAGDLPFVTGAVSGISGRTEARPRRRRAAHR